MLQFMGYNVATKQQQTLLGLSVSSIRGENNRAYFIGLLSASDELVYEKHL